MKRRSFVLAADTAALSATNALILIVGARLLAPGELSSLTMTQLLVVTVVGLQRATLLTPVFASHRSTGITALPLRWTLYISVPTAIGASAVMPLLIPRGDQSYGEMAALCFWATLPAVSQDMLRFAFFTRQSATLALISDLTWLIISTSGLIVSAVVLVPDWKQLILIWGGAGAIAFCVALFLVWKDRQRHVTATRARIRDVWKFGKWSGADAALSGAANLLPMVVSTLALGSPVASVYRVLQTANGPFNILSTTFLTSAGMDAWKLSDAEEVRKLRRRTIKNAFMLSCIAIVFYAIAFPLILLVSGLGGGDSVRVALILMFSGVLGAATIPISASASAMGFQRVGFYIRVVVVVSALSVSILAATGVWIPWSDPVGVVAIISGVAGIAGWAVGYEVGYRRERL